MARPRSDERRNALLAAATEVIASDGLGASTAAIAKAAGGSNGSLFLYFETKSALFNALYVELKSEMGRAASAGVQQDAPVREQLRGAWMAWLGWATSNPQKRRALAQLEVSDDITPESHALASQSQASMAVLLQESRKDGPMADAPLMFVVQLASAIADTTMDSMIRDPKDADDRGAAAFEAIWRVIAG